MMNRLIAAIFCMACLTACGQPASGAVLAVGPSGIITAKASLADCRTSANTVECRVTSALSAVQSNISSATVHGWGASSPRLSVKGGTIGNTTKFDLTGASVDFPGTDTVFAGTGRVLGLNEVRTGWFGLTSRSTPVDGSTAIQRSWDALPTYGGKLIFEPGEYWFNVIFENKSQIEVDGGGAIFHPYSGSSAMITVRALTGHTQECMLKNFRGVNQAGFTGSTAVGIMVSGVDDTKFNDFNSYYNITLDGFYNGIAVTHRAIWNTYEKIDIVNSLDIGFKVLTAYSFNANVFKQVRVASSQWHGMYIKHTAGTAISNNFRDCNFEGNGVDATKLLNSGIYLENVESTTIDGGYLENNGVGAGDGMGAAIRIAGAYGMDISVRGSQAWGSTYALDNRSTLSQGRYESNRWGSGKVHIQLGTSSDNLIEIGPNYGGTYEIVNDANGNSHVNYSTKPGFLGGSYNVAYTAVLPVDTLTVGSTVGTNLIAIDGTHVSFQNKAVYDCELVIAAGSVSHVIFERLGAGNFELPTTTTYRLSPDDIVYFTYSGAAPTIYRITR